MVLHTLKIDRNVIDSEAIGRATEDMRNLTVIPETFSEYVCRACQARLDHYGDDDFEATDKGAWVTECPKADVVDTETNTYGPHVANHAPLSWLDSAHIEFDESNDTVTVSLMINGSPLVMSVGRVTEPDHEDYGKLTLMVPRADPGNTRSPLKIHEIQPGAYRVDAS